MLNYINRISARCLRLLLPILLCSSMSVVAQQPKMSTDSDRKRDKQIEPQPSVKTKESRSSLPEYVPSEKVSADKAVSFPADI